MNPRKRLQIIINNCRQKVIAVQSWNDNRPDAKPLDCEPERVLLRLAVDAAALWDEGKMDEAQQAISKIVNTANADTERGA